MNKIDEKLRMLQPVLGTIPVEKLRMTYIFEDDWRGKKEIENHIDFLIAKHVKIKIDEEIILPPPDKSLCGGDLNIGNVEYLNRTICPFNLKQKDLNRHMGIFGSTGSGKTTMAKNIIRQLHKNNIPFLIFDWEKSYRNLIREFSDVQVFTVGSDINPIFLNFLTVPPGIKYDEYIKSIIAIISNDYIGGIGADTMLLNYMELAFEETKNPFFEDLKQIIVREINKDKGKRGRLVGRSGLWKETVQRQVAFISKGASGVVVNSRKHYPIEKLFSKPMVLEFGNLKSPHDKKFFIHVILNWLSIYNQHCGLLSEQLKQVLIFEEFHNIAMKTKEDDMVSSLFRESRKYGIGLVAIDQTPSEIPNAIFANLNTKISFSLGTSKDINAMAKAMNLDSEKTKYLGMLKTGQAIINVKQKHHDSFLLNTPFIKEDENVWDEELRSTMQNITCGTEALDFENSQASRSSQRIETTPPIRPKSDLNPLEKCLLTDIAERPFDGVDMRSKRLGFHPSQMSALHYSLTKKAVIITVNVGHRKLFEFTPEGREIAEKTGIKIPKQKARGGIEHSFGIYQTFQHLQKLGFKPVCEVQDIDIVDKISSIAIEIETGKSSIISNLLKLDKSRFKRRFMLAINKRAEFKIKNSAPDFPNITMMHLKDFAKLSTEEILNHQLSTHTHPSEVRSLQTTE